MNVMHDTALNINFFGGPGVGKSRTASRVFDELKMNDFNVDMTQEFAKELVYAEDWTRLGDQLLVAGEQHHRMFRMLRKVDYIVHDSPFVMGITYCCDTKMPLYEFNKYLSKQFLRYNNLNILLVRNPELVYKGNEGRLQDLEGAKEQDLTIRTMLDTNKIEYIEVLVNDDTITNIYNIIKDTYGK